MPISITFHGAAGTVTGSKHLLEIERKDGSIARLLLDCGMFQGEALADGSGKDRNRRFGFDPESIDALVLSHAHIDHSGLVPRLVKEGFRGSIWSTPATRDLCAIMLEDSARIQEYDAGYERKRAHRQGRSVEGGEPLYTVDDVPPAMARFQTMEYGERLDILPGVALTFTDTGHILGSAAVHLHLDDGDRMVRLAFTGDVGRYVDRLLPPPVPFPQADAIICEGTYGDRDHAPIAEAEEELLRHVREVCVERSARLIIPAFSIGKTQEILYTLNALSNAGRLPRIPVYVDSPLAIGATEIVRRYEKLFRNEVREELHHDPDLFSFPGVTFVRDAEGSKRLNTLREPCIVVSASGMMEAGRVRHHLLHALPDPANALLAVGFCAPGTLGHELLAGARTVRIFGEEVPVRAEVLRMDFYSAHADRGELLRYLACQNAAEVRKFFLVHGHQKALGAFQEQVVRAGFTDTVVPRRAQRFFL
ncbi:MAG: MBL fold metallo-hydrolase [Flavobacteriales bacterium]|nr:MBL fold metallo-hydrolase [Flavobacteriales bacterium]